MALISVLVQDYQNFELIVVDDGSADNSAAVIHAALDGCYEWSQVKRVEFISQSNQGVSAALNAGLVLARGDFVATFDADDLMPQGRLGLQVAYLLEHPAVGCLGGRAIQIDEKGKPISKKVKVREVAHFDFAEALASGLCVGGNIAMYRRDAMEQAGRYDPEIRIQDFQMTLKVAHAGYKIDILPDVVTLYRQHGSSLSKNYKAEYSYNLKVIQPYRMHPSYDSACARIIAKALHLAVIYDKGYAWELFRKIPLRQWDRKLLRRLRQFFFKVQKPWPFELPN